MEEWVVILEHTAVTRDGVVDSSCDEIVLFVLGKNVVAPVVKAGNNVGNIAKRTALVAVYEANINGEKIVLHSIYGLVCKLLVAIDCIRERLCFYYLKPLGIVIMYAFASLGVIICSRQKTVKLGGALLEKSDFRIFKLGVIESPADIGYHILCE